MADFALHCVVNELRTYQRRIKLDLQYTEAINSSNTNNVFTRSCRLAFRANLSTTIVGIKDTAHPQSHCIFPRALYRPRVNHLGSSGSHLQAIAVADALMLNCAFNNVWIGSKNAIDIGVNIA